MARYRRVRSNLKTRLAKARKPPKAPPQLSLERRLNFFHLPGELRNQIYRLHLVDPSVIVVKKNGFTEPPLLSACRRIRKETIPIYYIENGWEIDCPDWDPTLKLAFCKHLRSRPGLRSHKGLKTYWINSGSLTHKTGVIEYIKMLRSNPVLRIPTYEADRDPQTAAATGAFAIADRE